MHKADLVLGVLAVLALVLTGVAVAKSDDWTGERSYTYASAAVPLASQGPTGVGSVPTRFEWPAPINATGMRVNVTIAFSGQAVQGGSAIVRVAGIAPDGTQLPVQTRSLAIGQGATSAELVFDYAASWMDVPGRVRDTQQPPAQGWDKPLVVTVTVDRPGDLPAASYAFTATLVGESDRYTAA